MGKIIIFIAVFLCPFAVYSAVMQSNSYKLQSDSINFGGGLSSSTNYTQESTLGEIATGNSTSTSYNLSAGYQAMQSVYISVSDAPDIVMPAIGGISAGSSDSSSSWTVITDDPAGYSLSIVADTVPALKSSGSFVSDYAPAGADPDFTFSIASNISAFGFTPEGSDIVARYRDNGAVCNTGSSDTADRCWDGFSTTPQIISSGSTSNHPSGASTTVKYRAEVGSDKIQDAGIYTSTITVTAIAL